MREDTTNSADKQESALGSSLAEVTWRHTSHALVITAEVGLAGKIVLVGNLLYAF
jgi:hypothetical protein